MPTVPDQARRAHQRRRLRRHERAVRAVVRSGLAAGLEVFAVYEGLQGLVDGGDRIRPMSSADVGGILHQGGTVLGTARCADFRTRDGRRRAARNLVERGIDALVVIGGDGSLSGAAVFRTRVARAARRARRRGGRRPAQADAHRRLSLVGLVGSIDNDMFGTDMTIGADTALHRITEAVDALQSTASSHQRTFVIEVMGRNCGYLALMGSLATGANFVLIPESPPGRRLGDAMCDVLRAGRAIGRRASIVLDRRGRARRRRRAGDRRSRQGGARGAPRRGRPRHDPRSRPARRLAERVRPLPGHRARVRRSPPAARLARTASRSSSASAGTA